MFVESSKSVGVTFKKTIVRLAQSMRPVQVKMNSKKDNISFGEKFNDDEAVFQTFCMRNLSEKSLEDARLDAKELALADMVELQGLVAEALVAAAALDFADSLKASK